MRYLLMMWAEDDAQGGTEADYAAWITYEAALKEAGALIEGGALAGPASGKVVGTTLAGFALGEHEEAGSYPDSPLQLNGFYLIQGEDEAAAVRWANQMPTYGMVEVRPLLDFSDADWES